MTSPSLERVLLGHLLEYEKSLTDDSGIPMGVNLEDAVKRDRNFDPEFDAVLQDLQDRGLIARSADCYYRLTSTGLTFSSRG